MGVVSQTPVASVIVPSYNHSRFITECLGSVLATAADLELIVIDDGSGDDSVERIAAFAEDPRLRLVRQENRGAHAALNRGLGLARGEIVFLLNSDDVFEPRRIPVFLEGFASDPTIAVMCSWLRLIDADGRDLGIKEAWTNMPPWPRPLPGPGLADTGDPGLALLETNYVSTTSNVALRRRLIDDHHLRFAALRYTHDWEFLLAASHCGRLALIDEPLVRYRVHSANTLAEGQDEGQGLMRFEILWTLARHALQAVRDGAGRGMDPADLRRRMWRSLPRFERQTLLSQLLLLRGEEDGVPPDFESLLDPRHPFRRQAIRGLGSGHLAGRITTA